ncbi:hypothetical protein [Yinghuangia soli]|uniref:Uncharacterized protein n=1 Tax=Yinghuangia soli TaxID=2908204 RepID=A0AA41Q308_9ACTN|nr:hypothetical protein [Yinghuangia soli]MCF2530287.1 hypothetical protein [Yinghuangia soli]
MTGRTACAHTWEHRLLGRSADGVHTNRWTCAKCAATEVTFIRRAVCARVPSTGGADLVAGHVWAAVPGVAMTRCAACARVTIRAEAVCPDDAHDWPPDGDSRCNRCGHTVLDLYR